jgi:hypothetical protein
LQNESNMTQHHWFERTLALTVLAFGAIDAQAVSPACIAAGDSVGLKQALTNAANGSGSATVEVEQGTYIVPASGWSFDVAPGRDFSVLGGYVAGTNCQQRHVTASPNTSSTNTILDGQSQDGATIVFSQQPNTASQYYGTLTFEGFTVRNLKSSVGVTFALQQFGGGPHGIVFRYNWFHGNAPSSSAALLYTAGPMQVINNLIEGNTATTGLYLWSATYNAAPWRIVHNTVANNTATGLDINQTGSWVQMFNNIAYGNGGNDLVAVGAQVELHGDTYGGSTTSSGGSFINRGYAFAGTNPGMDAAFHLANGSNSINSGAAFAGLVPSQDLDGNARWTGSNPDRGAFESITSDQAYWLVTSSSDLSHADDVSVTCNPGSTTCTLREAIVRANAAGASRIDFDLGGTCGPQSILLNSPLPNVNVPLVVNGFSQPGASANNIALNTGAALDEKLCVVLMASIVNNVQSAFVVGPTNFGAQLDVRGVTFEGFQGHAIAIAQGSYHWIHGNTFGVETDANPFVIANAAGVSLYGGSFLSTIGGDAPADVNVFGKMSDSGADAVLLSSSDNGHLNHIVANNLIGLGLNQIDAVPNQGTGMIVESKYNEIYGNAIVAGGADGIDLVAANGNWLHNNQIGALPDFGEYLVTAYANLGGGIELMTGSSGNAIGAFDATGGIGFENGIMNNVSAGVWVGTDAGNGNTVVGNFVSENHGGLSIDLGAQGYGLGASTANNAQPAPVLNAGDATSYVLDPNEFYLNYSFGGTNGTNYRIDFYGSTMADCSFKPAERDLYWAKVTGTGSVQTATAAFVSFVAYGKPPLYVTATSTNLATGDTSEISNCITVKKDRLFSDGFEAKPPVIGV